MARGAITVKIDGQYDNKDIDKAIRDLNRLKTESGATKGPMDGLTGALGKMALAAGAALSIGAVVDFMKDAATAAIADEKSMVALATAMDNVGQGFANAGAEDFIKQMMLATGVADDELRPAFQRLVTATGDAAKSQDLLQTAMDVSAATGKDLVTVSTAISKAANGNIGALTRLGVPIDANIVKTKDFGAAVDVLNQKFGGQAAAAADTYGGQLKRVQTAASEAQETIGYALLNAVSDVSEAFGGTGGAVDAISGFGDAAANFVTGVGMVATEIAKLTAALADNQDEGTDWGNVVQSWGHALDVVNPVFSNLIDSVMLATDAGAAQTAVQDRLNQSLRGSEALYAGYIASLDGTAVEARGAEMAADDLRERLDEIKASFLGLTNALNASQSMDDFRESMRKLDETLKGNKRSFDGWAGNVKENRDSIRTAFADAAQIAQKWAEDNGKSAEQAKAYYDKLGTRIVAQFTKDGFKKSDIMAFLGGEGIWTGPALDRMAAIGRKGSIAAYAAGTEMGRNLALGSIAGLAGQSAGVQAAAMRLIAQAEAAANARAEINSPSRVFARIGGNLVDGLIVGLDSKKDKVKQAASDMLSGIFDKAEEMTSNWDDRLESLKDVLDSALENVSEWSSNMRDNLLSSFDIGAAYDAAIGEDGKLSAEAWVKGVDGQIAQIEWFGNVLKAIQANGGSNAQMLVDYLATKGAEQGGAMGQALIDNGLVQTMADKIGLVTTQATLTANAMVPAFMTAGVAQAQANYEGFKANYGEGGPARKALENLMDRIAASLNRTSTITVRTVYEAAGIAGKRAAGGPVAYGQAYLVGEKGPEVFVPSESGSIIPNGGLPSATMGGSGSGSLGGNSYSITVQAGVGDPRQIGQQVVEYIKRYESANGRVFAAA